MRLAPAARVAEWARAAARQVVGLAAALRRGAGRETSRRRVLWGAVAALLTLGPLAFDLARAPRYEASIALFPQRVGEYRAVFDPAYYRSLLADPTLREQMRLNVGTGVARYRDVTVRRGPRGSAVIVTVAAATPDDARRFVNALGPQIAGATQREVARLAIRDAATVRERLRRRGVSRRTRARLRARLRRLDDFRRLPPTRVNPGAPAPRPAVERWADRLVDRLPGDFPPRPAPAWAALAGLLVAVTLWGIALVVAPPRPRGAPPPRGGAQPGG